MKNTRDDFSLKGKVKLQDDDPIGPLEIARENNEAFADSFILQCSLREMLDWILTLEAVLQDPDITELEKKQTQEELDLMQQAWCAIADSLNERGINA